MIRALPLAAALALLSLAPAASAQSPEPLRVMSYNIRVDVASDQPNWTERRPHMASQIAWVDPDLLGVQEATPAMVAWLGERLTAWDRYGLGRDDGAEVGESATLFWRRDRFEPVSRHTFWCSPTPDVPSKGWDADYPRTVTRVVLRDRHDGRLWDVRNTHFDHVGVEARARCADLVAALPPVEGAEVVLMGDFNTGPDSDPYRRLIASGLRDARTVSPVVFGPAGTYNAFDLGKDNDGVAIDHVFLGDGVSVTRFGVLTDSFAGKVISDHFPVVVDVTPEP
ncbi:MAG: endonuclease/exonuclease/phosphatase family protein [Brevundimonas sp.]|nr:MAG: endonuclease/exonuclease/phosphatase family protein [Brevundimonas sp.]